MMHRIGIPRDPWPFTGHRSMAEVWAVEPQPESAPAEPKPQQQDEAAE